ncbi:hypothetical protein C8F04DRAFT_1201158 [Mycena alexandri]|uniref:Uncharacterized protein n=1 Tax=Mycena alexandri TaxID=1745969 RepID=A0AAD6RX21_9AGAR|nr:hypothetical protein C8F04DRAFT_1201158 [Mycena alexandri]
MSSDAQETFILRDVFLDMTLLQTFFHVLKRKTSPLLLTVVVAMFAMSTIQLALNWQRIRTAFISNGDTALDTANTLENTPMAIVIVGSTMLVMNNLLADCVLIHRVHTIWNRDWRVIVLPILTCLASAGELFLGSFSFNNLTRLGAFGFVAVYESAHFNTTPRQHVHKISTSNFSLTLATTLMATILVVFRIVWVTWGHSDLGFSGYRAVIEVVVESAFLYSETLIIYIALLFTSTTSDNDGYGQAVLIEMTGIAPTLIVARVSFGLSRPSSSWQRSTNGGSPGISRPIHFVSNEDVESGSAPEKVSEGA